eukprot:10940691-Alexandrium_andersonii.AAC.1
MAKGVVRVEGQERQAVGRVGAVDEEDRREVHRRRAERPDGDGQAGLPHRPDGGGGQVPAPAAPRDSRCPPP